MDGRSQLMLDRYWNDTFLDTLLDLHIDCIQQPHSAACATATALGLLSSIAVPIIVVLGCFGNSITAHILLIRMRTKRSARTFCIGGGFTRQHMYLAWISLSDMANLISWGIAWQFLARGLPWISGGTVGFIVPNVSDATCRSFRFVHNFFHALSANWFLLMTFDRLASLYLPLRVRSLSPRDAGRALIVVAATTLAMVCPVPAFIGWYDWQVRIACLAVPSYGRVVQVWTILSNALLMLPPTLQLLLIAVLNLLLLARIRHRVRRLVGIDRRSVHASSMRTNRGSRELGPTLQVLCLSAIFFISGVPTCVVAILVMHQTVFSTDTSAQVLRSVLNIGDIGQILLLANQSANWLVLVWRDRHFRAHLCEIVGRGHQHQVIGEAVGGGAAASIRRCNSTAAAGVATISNQQSQIVGRAAASSTDI